MFFNNLIYFTKRVPIINEKCEKIEEIVLKEQVYPIPRRRCAISNTGIYYKGAGIIYTSHFVNEYSDNLRLVSETGIVYEKYNVVYPSLFRKYGIFTFKHQPCFSDFEGGCGEKEKNIIRMQEAFDLSAIKEIVNVIDTPLKDHCIYSYRIKELKGNYHNTLTLMEYILKENFNTGWDKNLWEDIESFGYVRDLADWFISEAFCHKLGTIYALLNSLFKKDRYVYEVVVRTLTNLEQLDKLHIIYISALIVRKFSPKCVPAIDLDNPNAALYEFLWNELFSGKACCHLENENEWNFVKSFYQKSVSRNVSLAMKDLAYHRLMKI